MISIFPLGTHGFSKIKLFWVLTLLQSFQNKTLGNRHHFRVEVLLKEDMRWMKRKSSKRKSRDVLSQCPEQFYPCNHITPDAGTQLVVCDPQPGLLVLAKGDKSPEIRAICGTRHWCNNWVSRVRYAFRQYGWKIVTIAICQTSVWRQGSVREEGPGSQYPILIPEITTQKEKLPLLGVDK